MKKTVFLLALFAFAYLFTACDDPEWLKPMHERISGVWRFDEVKYRDNWAVNRSDITGVYAPFEIEFLPNRLVVLYFFDATGTLNAVEGLWEYDYLATGCFDGSCNEDRIIHFYFHEPIPPFFVHEWHVRRLRYNTIKARERRSGGIYNFTLKRIE